jgi:hypothetical protein
MSTAAALWALVVQYLRPGLLIAKITKAWQVPPYPPRWHTWRKAKSKTDSPHTHVDERWSARGCNHGGGRIGRWSRRQTRRPTTTKTMVRACYETSSWAYNSHCAGRCRGWCRTNTGRRRRRHEGREKRSRMANEVATIESRTIIMMWRYR